MMTTFRLNTSLLARTGTALLVAGGVTYFLHLAQMGRHARGQVALADDAAAGGDKSAVVSALQRSLSFDGDNPEVRARFAMALADRASNSAERWKALKALRDCMGKDEKLRLRAAEVAAELGEYVEAGKCVEPLIKADPKRGDLYERLAGYQLAAKNVDDAVKSLQMARDLSPARVEVAVKLAELLRDRQSQPVLADATLDRLVNDNPRLAEARVARARWRMRAERLDAADADLARARELAPRDADVLTCSAELAGRRGMPEKACDYWSGALVGRPADPTIRIGLAQAQRECGRAAPAVATLREGLRRAPDDVELRFRLADALVDLGEVKEAESLRAKLPQPQAKGRALFVAGRAAQRDKRWLDAARLYVDAIQCPDVRPELGSRLMLELARCYGGLGARDEQFLATLQAARLAPTPHARLVMSEMLVAAGRGDDAIPLLRSLAGLPTPPRDTWGLLARALLDHHRARPAWQRRWRDVEEALGKAATDPNQAVSTAVVQAEMLWMRHDAEGATRAIETTLKSHPMDPVLYLALADLAARKGDEAAARAALSRGDEAIGDRLDWLAARAGRLAGQRDAEAHQQLVGLEKRGEMLKPEERDQLTRHLADLHARMDNQADVERLASAILARHPGDVRARLLLVDALLARKDEVGACRYAEQVKAIEGEGGTGWRCAVVACRLAEAKRGKRDGVAEAHRLINEIEEIRPNWSQASFLAARLADAEKRPDAALHFYQQVLARGDYHPAALTRLVQILTNRKRWGDASALLEQVNSKGGLDRDLLRPAAWIAVRAGKYDRGRELAQLAVPPGTTSYRDLLWLGRLLDAADHPTEAADAFDEAIRLAPDVQDVWLARVNHLVQRKRPEDADAVLGRMKEKLTGQRRDLTLGQAQEILGRFGDAEKTYRAAAEQNPSDPLPLQRLANLLVRVNEPEKAEVVLAQLLDAKGALPEEDIPDLRRQLALAMTAPEQASDRVEDALELLAKNEGAGEADQRVRLLVRGRMPEHRVESLQALEALGGGAAVLPEEKLRLARLYEAEGAWPQARKLLISLVNDDENNAGLMAVLIEGLLNAGKVTEAATWLARLEKLEHDTPRVKEFRDLVRIRP